MFTFTLHKKCGKWKDAGGVRRPCEQVSAPGMAPTTQSKLHEVGCDFYCSVIRWKSYFSTSSTSTIYINVTKTVLYLSLFFSPGSYDWQSFSGDFRGALASSIALAF